jgi:hypothetical protein
MKITENTTITVGLLVVILGAVAWMTKIAFLAESAASMAAEVKTVQEKYLEDFVEVKTDVKWIKRKMGGE